MQDAAVVHFREDIRCRVAVLAANGFKVKACGTSIAELDESLRQAPDAVAIDEDGSPDKVDLVSIVRAHHWAPLVLFRGAHRKLDAIQFDVVIPERARDRDWLLSVSGLIEQSRALVAMSKSILAQSEVLHEQLRNAQEKLRLETMRSRSSRSRSNKK